jgi:hypothetical protein
MTDEEVEQALKDYGKIVSEINELLGNAENTNDLAEQAIAKNNKEVSLENAKDAAAAAQQVIVDARHVSEKITELLPKFPPLQYHNGRPEGKTPEYYEMLSLQEKAMKYEKEAKVELERAEDARFGSGTLEKATGGRRRRRR